MLSGEHKISRGCSNTTEIISSCRDNTSYDGRQFFFNGSQCCYSYQSASYAVTLCYCTDDYCNGNFAQATLLRETNDSPTPPWQHPQDATAQYNLSTTQLPWNSNNSLNNTGLVNCYSCWYSGNAINMPTNVSCKEPFISYDGGSCGGGACATYMYASASDGNFVLLFHLEFMYNCNRQITIFTSSTDVDNKVVQGHHRPRHIT